MELSPEQLESIGRYVRGNLSAWMGEVYTQRDLQLTERMVRVEEELKTQRELMQQGFSLMEKRFEQMAKSTDQRFEQVEKRFEDMHRFSNRWFTVITIMLGIITLGGSILGYLGVS